MNNETLETYNVDMLELFEDALAGASAIKQEYQKLLFGEPKNDNYWNCMTSASYLKTVYSDIIDAIVNSEAVIMEYDPMDKSMIVKALRKEKNNE